MEFFLILLIGAGIWIAVYLVRRQASATTAPAAPIVFTPPPPTLRVETRLDLPSSQPLFKFTVPVTISYTVRRQTGQNHEDNAKAEILRLAGPLAAQYPLTQTLQFEAALRRALAQPLESADKSLSLSAACSTVQVDPRQLQMVEEVELTWFKVDQEERLFAAETKRIERLDRLQSEPRTAALYWLSKQPYDHQSLERMPRVTELMFEIDRALNQRAQDDLEAPLFRVFAPQAEDLDDFLNDSDAEEQRLLFDSLARAYEHFGRPAMAARARELVTDRETPRSDEGEPMSAV